MKRLKIFISTILVTAMLAASAIPVFADSSNIYVALGADLNQSQRQSVLQMMGLTESDLSDVKTTTITNQMEKDTLGKYLPASVIGSRALSCVKVQETSNGGINVTTHNISYCTEGMYQNALITAGIKNADVQVVAPSNISGTAGLVGAMKAYEELTGKDISSENSDAAVDELVTTGNLAQDLGSSKDAENLIALTKQKVAAGDLKSDDDIMQAIRESANDLGITLSDSEVETILDLMKKISKLDLSESELRQQASNIYDRLSNLGIDMSQFDKQSFIDKVSAWFSDLITFCKNLFQ